jgi:hypothetical protein
MTHTKTTVRLARAPDPFPINCFPAGTRANNGRMTMYGYPGRPSPTPATSMPLKRPKAANPPVDVYVLCRSSAEGRILEVRLGSHDRTLGVHPRRLLTETR